MPILKDLNFKIDQEKKVEDEIELAREKMRKMVQNIEECSKKIEEDKRMQGEKMHLEL
jgi:hypothetical protein